MQTAQSEERKKTEEKGDELEPEAVVSAGGQRCAHGRDMDGMVEQGAQGKGKGRTIDHVRRTISVIMFTMSAASSMKMSMDLNIVEKVMIFIVCNHIRGRFCRDGGDLGDDLGGDL